MSILADALQPFIVPSLFGVRGQVKQTLDDLIGSKGGFYPSFDAATAKWDFNFGVAEAVAEFLAHECSRFSSASFQTYAEVADDLRSADRVPWALVRAYYGAFYAGHSILRIIGTTCTYIDGARAAYLRQLLALHGLGSPFSGGMYETTVDAAGTSLRFQNLGSGQGGTHEVFWRVLDRQLASIEERVLTGPLSTSDAQQVWSCIGNLRKVLSRGGANDSWLSAVRNSIQYRQELRVWYPLQPEQRDRTTLSRIATGWNGDPLQIQLGASTCGDLGSFLAACTFLVATCKMLVARIAEKGRRGREQSFAHYGPVRFLHSRQCA